MSDKFVTDYDLGVLLKENVFSRIEEIESKIGKSESEARILKEEFSQHQDDIMEVINKQVLARVKKTHEHATASDKMANKCNKNLNLHERRFTNVEESIENLNDNIEKVKSDFAILRAVSKDTNFIRKKIDSEMERFATIKNETIDLLQRYSSKFDALETKFNDKLEHIIRNMPVSEDALDYKIKQAGTQYTEKLKVDLMDYIEGNIELHTEKSINDKISTFTKALLNGILTSLKDRIVKIERAVKVNTTSDVSHIISIELSKMLPGYSRHNTLDRIPTQTSKNLKIDLSSIETVIDIGHEVNSFAQLESPVTVGCTKILTLNANDDQNVSVLLGGNFCKSIKLTGESSVSVIWIYDGYRTGWSVTSITGNVIATYNILSKSLDE